MFSPLLNRSIAICCSRERVIVGVGVGVDVDVDVGVGVDVGVDVDVGASSFSTIIEGIFTVMLSFITISL
jgi:hypothetical protein